MVVDIKTIKSHPDKFLITQDNGEKGHVDGVIENVKKLTSSKWAELVAIFHDLGKINPNFSNKLVNSNILGNYANHSYMSAFAFFVAFATKHGNREKLRQWLNQEAISGLEIIASAVIIAKHHGNLPNLKPEKSDSEDIARILFKDENNLLFNFLTLNNNLPIDNYSKHYLPFLEDFQDKLLDNKIQNRYRDELIFDAYKNFNPLCFFQNIQSAFASLIHADKADAAKFDNLIDDNKENLRIFNRKYNEQLNRYLGSLMPNTSLNKLRTEIRNNSVLNIVIGLKEGKRLFELTAPTGSGKTLMLLSLAGEIIKSSKEPLRVVYALPFLSITEQVEEEVLKIFSETTHFIQRIDSKSENSEFEKLQEKLETDPNQQNRMAINLLDFREKTFSYPFIITTFVRFFETLLSNKNSDLLKLPNLSNCIFLLDEIQSLPPRLYSFFIAYLDSFCKKNNCYTIVSTATQPNFSIDNVKLNDTDGNGKYLTWAKDFFKHYENPYSLLSTDYFQNGLFNRYVINILDESVNLQQLADKVVKENESALVIVNTIDDSKQLYDLLLENDVEKQELILLNTHFTPDDRKFKIEYAKLRLKFRKKIIVISTMLIEAGVDIDFPILYRDLTSMPSIVQSSGRCNRNGKMENKGKVILFHLMNSNDRSALIFRGKDRFFLDTTKQVLKKKSYAENDLLELQVHYFNQIQTSLNFAQHSQTQPKHEFHFLKDIQECMYQKLGDFRIIDEVDYGIEYQFYVPVNEKDTRFEVLLEIEERIKVLQSQNKKEELFVNKQMIVRQLKQMANQIVKVRLKKNDSLPVLGDNRIAINFLYKINLASYSFDSGIYIKGEDFII